MHTTLVVLECLGTLTPFLGTLIYLCRECTSAVSRNGSKSSLIVSVFPRKKEKNLFRNSALKILTSVIDNLESSVIPPEVFLSWYFFESWDLGNVSSSENGIDNFQFVCTTHFS